MYVGCNPVFFSMLCICAYNSWDSAVCIVTGYRLDDRGVRVPVPGYQALFLGGGHETDHSSPTSAKVKKTWVYASTPPYVFIA
jgi:hypothetical protein